jgi:hypothetical protein
MEELCEGRPLPVVMIEKAIEAGVGDGLKWVAWATEVIALATSVDANHKDVRLNVSRSHGSPHGLAPTPTVTQWSCCAKLSERATAVVCSRRRPPSLLSLTL